MKKNKYEGSWSANNGSSYNSGYRDNNKRRLAKAMKDICDSNIFPGNVGVWSVYSDEGKRSSENDSPPLLSGRITRRR